MYIYLAYPTSNFGIEEENERQTFLKKNFFFAKEVLFLRLLSLSFSLQVSFSLFLSLSYLVCLHQKRARREGRCRLLSASLSLSQPGLFLAGYFDSAWLHTLDVSFGSDASRFFVLLSLSRERDFFIFLSQSLSMRCLIHFLFEIFIFFYARKMYTFWII